MWFTAGTWRCCCWQKMSIMEICVNSEPTRRWQVTPQAAGGTCRGLLLHEDEPCTQPSVQHTGLQEWGRHERLSLWDNDCSAQLGGNGQRSLRTDELECVCERASTEKLLRNVWIHARERIWVTFKGTLLSSPSEEISQPHQKAWQPHFMELMEVLCAGLILVEERNRLDEMLFYFPRDETTAKLLFSWWTFKMIIPSGT